MAQSISSELAPVLAAAGLKDLSPLLDERPVELRVPGEWERLSKPGLAGRERLRWLPQTMPAEGREEAARRQSTALYVKRYLRIGWREQFDRIWRQAVRHSRAWWEFRQSERLREKFISVVRAVAVVERMRGPFERGSAAIFKPAPGDALDRVWTRLLAAGAPQTRAPRRHDLTRGLARFVSAFHQTGYCHRDLYLCHVFVELDAQAAAAPPRFTLIDLARTHFPRLRRLRWVIKDLSQLDYSAAEIGATRSDRIRFLLTYLGLRPGAPRVRYYARRIAARSDAIRRRELRKRRTD